MSGDYEFIDARLDTIKGIGGILNSTGSFEGVLEHINVKGTTTTPDFQLNLAKQPVNLDTRFIAVVDGTSGDTYLEEVDATLGPIAHPGEGIDCRRRPARKGERSRST